MQAFRDLKLMIGLSCLTLVIFMAAFGGLITPYGPAEQDLLSALQPPDPWNGGHILGTDQLGRDIFARMVSGARVSLSIAVCVVLISGVFGILLGALSGYWGGVRDQIIQKVVEAFWAFPALLLALTVLAFFGQSLTNVIVALSLQRWIPYCRIARAQALVVSTREFVAASQVLGGGTFWIVRRHILPNILSTVIVIATFSMASAILAEAALSFLGVGVPLSTATWGGMLAEGRSFILSAWWLAVFPGVGIVITVLGLNLVGDWARDYIDPKKVLNVR